jgi:phosphoribosylglycinamide formyltransferase-1
MSNKKSVAVLISGNGSNLQALIDACEDRNFPAKIDLVISNKQDAYGLKRAKKADIKTEYINHKDFQSREEFDAQIDIILQNNDIEIVCLAGFMRLLSESFVNNWQNRMINIHPSLLPAFKGANAIDDAIKYGVKIIGCTTHYVTAEMDAGPIIKQAAYEIKNSDSNEDIKNNIHKLEHKIYPESLKIVCEALS